MSKELKYLSPGESDDRVATMIGDFRAVTAINGHVPDDAEIREALELAGLEPTDQTIATVRDGLK
jgi:hypothetical protein